MIKYPLTTESAMKKIEDNNTLVRAGCSAGQGCWGALGVAAGGAPSTSLDPSSAGAGGSVGGGARAAAWLWQPSSSGLQAVGASD